MVARKKLSLFIPEDYPLQSPPMFQINAPWLRGKERRDMEGRLSEIYCENLGEDLIYLWVEAIREHLQNKAGDRAQESGGDHVCEGAMQSSEADDADDDFSLALLQGEVVSSLQAMDLKTGEEYECPKIFHGETLTDRRSTFQPHLAPILFKQQIVNAENVMVVVSRWYGGIQLGPDRFKHINNCTRMILEQHGYLAQREEKRGPRSGKKGK